MIDSKKRMKFFIPFRVKKHEEENSKQQYDFWPCLVQLGHRNSYALHIHIEL